MITSNYQIAVGDLIVEVESKSIKNLHLGVYPPTGRVRVAAPLSLSKDAVRLAIVGKLSWIKRQQAKFASQPRQSGREMISGETHFFLGRRYRLRVIEQSRDFQIVVKNKVTLHLIVAPYTARAKREQILYKWYREQLEEVASPLIAKWQDILSVEIAECRIKRMKTKWGSCNRNLRRIWLNLELIKKPVHCLEYVIFHELAHLLIRHHNDSFINLMDKHMPNWRASRDELNSLPLAHENWF